MRLCNVYKKQLCANEEASKLFLCNSFILFPQSFQKAAVLVTELSYLLKLEGFDLGNGILTIDDFMDKFEAVIKNEH